MQYDKLCCFLGCIQFSDDLFLYFLSFAQKHHTMLIKVKIVRIDVTFRLRSSKPFIMLINV